MEKNVQETICPVIDVSMSNAIYRGPKGDSATINGVPTIDILAGNNITLDQKDNQLTISATGGGGGSGENGATFIPTVSTEGVISWENDKGLPNPEPVDIKGTDATINGVSTLTMEQGKNIILTQEGNKLTIAADNTDNQPKNFPVNVTKSGETYSADKTYREVQTAFVQGRNVYLVYNDAEYYPDSKSQGPSPYFRFSRTSIGSGIATERKFIYRLDGLNPILEYQEHSTTAGSEGLDGATFTPAVSPEGVISWTNDKGLANPDPVDIKGAEGPAGESGVYRGSTEPTNPDINVWLDTSGGPSPSLATETYVNEAIASAATPIASTLEAGKVKPDGSTILVTEDGTISSVGGGGSSKIRIPLPLMAVSGAEAAELRGLLKEYLNAVFAGNGDKYELYGCDTYGDKQYNNFSVSAHEYRNAPSVSISGITGTAMYHTGMISRAITDVSDQTSMLMVWNPADFWEDQLLLRKALVKSYSKDDGGVNDLHWAIILIQDPHISTYRYTVPIVLSEDASEHQNIFPLVNPGPNKYGRVRIYPNGCEAEIMDSLSGNADTSMEVLKIYGI